METYAAKYYPRYDFDFPISTLFRGALIFLALVVACLLVGKAIEWLRNRRKFDAVAADGAHPKDPEEPSEPWDQAISNPSADQISADEWGGFKGMNQREEEEFFSTYGDRKVRKAMTKRRRAREAAQKKQQSES